MNTRTKLASAIALIMGAHVPQLQAATPPVGSLMTITSGTELTDAYGTTTNVNPGSWFGMDNNGDSKILGSEKVALQQGSTGLVIGRTSSAGASHGGPPRAGDTNEVDRPWAFFGNTGSDYLTVGVTGDTTSGLDFSGWTVTWNGIEAIPMGAGAWQPLNCSVLSPGCTSFSEGVANFSWDGSAGGTYTLDYTARVPAGDPSGFGGVQYYLHLEGTIENDPPVAGDTTGQINPGGTIIDDALEPSDPNSSTGTPNSGPFTCAVVSQPSNGTVTINAQNCTYSYTHDGGASTSDSFTYSVNDGISDSATPGTVSITISNNLPPRANNFTVNAAGGTTTEIDFAANTTDDNNQVVLTSLNVSNCSQGSVVTNSNGTGTYTPPANFTGTATCQYTFDDEQPATSSPGTVTIAVHATAASSNSGTYNGTVTTTVPADSESSRQCIGGCFDFTVSGFTGNSVRVVLPLSEPIPNGAVYRKYVNNSFNVNTWVNYVATSGNTIATAASIQLNGQTACPPADSTSYTTSIVPGNDCVRLTLVDQGEYDNNSSVGIVSDPGGIAVPTPPVASPSGSSGCTLSTTPRNVQSAADWWLVGLLLGGLGLLRRRVRR